MMDPTYAHPTDSPNAFKPKYATERMHLWMLLLACLGCPLSPLAQDNDLLKGTVKGGFKATISDGDRVNTVFRGKELDGTLITGLSIQFNEDNEAAKPKFFAESPQCERNPQTENITSTASIKFWTADESLIIEGMGWSWQKSQSLLIISNNVSTTIRKDFIGTVPSAASHSKTQEESRIQIRSDRFSFQRTTSMASYQNNVTAEDPGRLNMSCNQLHINLGEDSEQLKEVVAEGSVQLNLLDPKLPVEAKSGRAIYTFGSGNQGTLELLDAPTWLAPGYEGGGDRIVVSDVELNGHFMVLGNARASLDPTNIRSQAQPDQGDQASLIEVTSDQYNFDGSKVRFEGLVKASQEQHWSLQCDTLSAGVHQASRQVGEIEAEGNVRLTQTRQGTSIRSQANHALYRPLQANSESIVLTGSAEVDTGEYLARGQTIELVQSEDQQSIDVSGLATLELPVTTVLSIGILNLPDSKTEMDPSTEPARLRVTSDRYRFEDQSATFEQNVIVYFADSTMECHRMDVQFTPDRKGIETLVATGNILFSGDEGRMTCQRVEGFFSENSHQMERLVATDSVWLAHPMGKAKGNQAIFYPDTATIQLTGDPQVVAQVPSSKGGRPKYFHAQGGVLYWNQARSRFSGKGMRVKTIDNPDLW